MRPGRASPARDARPRTASLLTPLLLRADEEWSENNDLTGKAFVLGVDTVLGRDTFLESTLVRSAMRVLVCATNLFPSMFAFELNNKVMIFSSSQIHWTLFGEQTAFNTL